MMLLHLTLLHKATTTTVLALFPFVVTSTTSGHKAHHANVDLRMQRPRLHDVVCDLTLSCVLFAGFPERKGWIEVAE
jgi:hypothetical protein